MKNYRDQDDLKCCYKCKFSEIDENQEHELFCYDIEPQENVSYLGICDNFECYGQKIRFL